MCSKQQYFKKGLSPSICINCLDFSLREGKEGINPAIFTECKMICWVFLHKLSHSEIHSKSIMEHYYSYFTDWESKTRIINLPEQYNQRIVEAKSDHKFADPKECTFLHHITCLLSLETLESPSSLLFCAFLWAAATALFSSSLILCSAISCCLQD